MVMIIIAMPRLMSVAMVTFFFAMVRIMSVVIIFITLVLCVAFCATRVKRRHFWSSSVSMLAISKVVRVSVAIIVRVYYVLTTEGSCLLLVDI